MTLGTQQYPPFSLLDKPCTIISALKIAETGSRTCEKICQRMITCSFVAVWVGSHNVAS